LIQLPVHLSDDTEAYAVVTENADSLIVTYPEFNKSNTTMLQHGKSAGCKKKQKDEIHIRKGTVQTNLKIFGLAINKKYALVFSKELDDRMGTRSFQRSFQMEVFFKQCYDKQTWM